MELLLIAAAAFLAFSNGANDNFKGFATVWGSQTLTYRQALALASIATALGSLLSLVLAQALLQHFSGKGLVPEEIAGSSQFLISVSLGAAFTVMLATRLGLPISTTHALIGALVGAGLARGGGVVNPANLAHVFVLPLLISPFVAAGLGTLASRFARHRERVRDCACIESGIAAPASPGGTAVMTRADGIARVRIDTDVQCDRIAAPLARVRISSSLDRVHTLSAASICFARGVNDTPKLAALLLAAQAFDVRGAIVAIAVLMVCGGLLFSRRVAHTMSQRMTTLSHSQGLAANLLSAGLIIFASKLGMPVSTTHVTVGSIAGVGLGARCIDWRTTRAVLLSWAATLPLAALAAYFIARVI